MLHLRVGTGWTRLHGWWSCCLKPTPAAWAGDTPQGTLAALVPLPGQARGHPPVGGEDPTSGVGGHVGHFLEGIQEGDRGQHRGPGAEREQGGSSAGTGHPGVCPPGGWHPPSRPTPAHLSWECSLVAFELKSSQMG